MVKKICVILALLAVNVLLFGQSKPTGNYAIRCYKCEEHAEKHHFERSCPGCPAWRMFQLENSKNEGCLVYHCQHGHTLRINKSTGEKR